ncbi:MAG: FtsX-like permease family protein [Acidimicrobiales bacterium]
MKLFRLLSVRRLRYQPLRVAVAVLAIAAGVALTVTVVTVTTSIQRSVLDFGRTLAGPAPLRVVGASLRGGLPVEALATIEATEGVDAAVPMVQAVSFVDRAGGDGDPIPVFVLGVDCRVEALLGTLGCDPAAVDAAGDQAALVGAALRAESGSGATLRTDLGRVDLDAAPAIPQLDQLGEGRVVVFGLPGAQQRFVRPGLVDVAYIQPDDGADVDELQVRLQAALGEHLGVVSRDDPPPQIEQFLVQFVPLFGLIGLFALGTGAALVHNTMTLSLEERRRQLAIIGALGGRARTVAGGAVLEMAVLGAAGGALGTLAGIAVARPITASLTEVTQAIAGVPLDVHVTPAIVVIGVVLGAAIGGGAALWPAWRATRLDVAAELSGRQQAAEQRQSRLLVRLAVFGILFVVALVGCWLTQRNGGIEPWQATVGPLSFLLAAVAAPMTGTALAPLLVARLAPLARRSPRAGFRLAVANLVRDPRRTGVMSLGITAAVMTAFATDGFVQSARASIIENFEREVEGVSVSTIGPDEGGSAFLGPDQMAAIAAVPGTGEVRRGAFVVAGHRSGDILAVEGFEGEVFDAHLILGTADPERLAAGEVVVGPAVARTEGVRPGDQVELDTPDGRVALPVQGVWENGDFGGRNVVVPYELIERLYGPQPPAFVVVEPEPGVATDQLADSLRAAAPGIDSELQVWTPRELALEIVEVINEQMFAFRVMQRGLLIVAFVAVLSTLLLIGVQRQRELGLLAAVGSRPAELGRMVLGEAGVIGVVSLALSALFGPLMLWALLQVIPVVTGFRDPFHPDWSSLLTSGSVAVAVTLAAALWPAWRAARVEVLDALRYE